MKKTFIWLVASLLFTMVGCVEALREPGMTETSSGQLPNLTAGFVEEETKTYVESGKYLRWHEDDRLTAFYGNTLNRQYKFNGATGDNSGSFSYVPSGNLETGNALDRIYAVYPYDETATITDNGQISLTLPAVQTYAENSFGRGANTMLAATENVDDTFLGFKNACGYLKLKFYNAEGVTIKSIVVKGNGEEKIAGAANATIAFGGVPQLTMADEATTTITLDCGDGVALGTTAEAATEFWVVIPETTFEGGITITVTDTEGGIFEKSTTKEVAIERNAVQPMAALGVEVAPAGPAKNEIWYTNGSTTEATEPYKTDVFGANIASNTYDAEKECWVIKFDGAITTIGEEAFRYCTSLTSVTIGNGVTSIGNYAFQNCTSLTSVTIGNSVTSIGYQAFQKCTSLTSVTIPDSVTEIEWYAFQNCTSLTSVTIGNGVTYINGDAFDGCRNLTSVYISDIAAWCNMQFINWGSNPLLYQGNLFLNNELVTDLTIPDSVTEIRNYTFYNLESLRSVTIPNSVTSIGDSAFFDCKSLTSITIPDSVTSIGDSAFWCCSSLTSATIGNSVTSIEDAAFAHCTSLTSVTIPDSVTSIEYSAFIGCTSLESVTIGNGVTSIGDMAFADCTSLTAFYGKIASTDNRCLVIDGVLNSFAPAGLSEYDIPDSVTEIGDYAFYGCDSLTSITIPDSVTTIGWWAFQYCTSLKEFYCKAISPPVGYQQMFSNNASGRKIYVPAESVATYKSTRYWSDYATDIVGYYFDNGVVAPIKPATNEIWYTNGSTTSKTVPYTTNAFGANIVSNTYDAEKECWVIKFDGEVTTIGKQAFFSCTSLTSITIPDSVTEIGNNAFLYCI